MSDSFDRILMISGPFFFCFFSPSSLVDENMQENERNLNFKFQFFFYPWVDWKRTHEFTLHDLFVDRTLGN